MDKEGQEKPNKNPIAEREEETLKFWKENDIFEKTLEKESPEGEFIFYEGPPTANGRPGIHHLEARAFKDIIPRYKTMQGFHVARKAGWDTHGLPVELEVEKRLGLKSKKEIEEYGIAKFNGECKKSVWTYVDEWKDFTNRIGYWVDMKNPYVTYEASYIESIWNILKIVEDKKLLYKDYKVLPWCPRCGTALSSHELAQGYEDVKDISVYVKFRITNDELGITDNKDTYILAWTTTPWTLPGHVALAVGKDIEYVEIKVKSKEGKEENLILAKSRLEIISDEYEIVREIKGKDLVGLKYEPPYSYLKNLISAGEKEKLAKAFQVYEAGFVTDTDGTGIVHTAVMYGQDDFVLGTALGLPKFHMVNITGHFIKGTDFLEDKYVNEEETTVSIIKDLAHRNILLKKEKYEHSYPFCWRCKTRLIYYARDSWYIKMSSLKDILVSSNSEINWEPENIRDGRFGEWIKDVKDWAISRERYWGTPIPVWIAPDGERLVVDSFETLKKYTKHNHNKFFIIRHGGTEGNKKGIISYANQSKDHLTQDGKEQVIVSAKDLKNKNIDVIVSSPFTRTRETANILAKELGLNESDVVFDERLQEINPGEFDGKSWNEYHNNIYNLKSLWYDNPPPGGESLKEAAKRIGSSLYDLESKYKNKNILIVTHGGPAWIAYTVAGIYPKEINEAKKIDVPIFSLGFKNAEVREFPFVPLPHNDYFELDPHKPYIDGVVLEKDGKEFKRVKEVLDAWFDSGAMPFAQSHYPFENKKWVDGKGFPADYISEAIDQTRGWFYTLHAIGALMGRGKVYKNVICLGLLLDEKGQKMSKSKGNVVSPWEMMDKYGADALRYWMYTVNQPGESKNFDERTVDDVVKKVFNLLGNVVKFYELYAGARTDTMRPVSENVLDQWILAYLDSTTLYMTQSLDGYKVLEPARAIRDFIADLSQWYLRRSRDRFKGDDEEDKKMAINTLGYVLEQFSIVMAPFMPFFAEEIYQKVRAPHYPMSVHLENWPQKNIKSAGDVLVLGNMVKVRELVTLGLEARAKSGIKIRQPLRALTLRDETLREQNKYLELIMDEVNVKQISFDSKLENAVFLDTEIDEELKREGEMRELTRAIQEFRKEKNLLPSDRLDITLKVNEWGMAVVNQFESDIKSICGLTDIILESKKTDDDAWFEIVS
jgi:isoleucyl-tRNA synthetase